MLSRCFIHARARTRALTLLSCLSLMAAAEGCGDDIAEASAGADDAGTDGGTGDDTGGDGDGDGMGDGSIRGLVSFNYYPADAVGNPDLVGFSAGFRTAPFEETDDFHAALAFDLTMPVVDAALDEAVFLGVPAPMAWGKSATWITAGTGINLLTEDVSSSACLFNTGINLEYPVYTASAAPMFAAECAPDVSDFVFDADYTLGVFGGDAFMGDGFVGIKTPAALTVTSPDLDVEGLPVSRTSPLDIAWEANGSDASEVIIRVWDAIGGVLAARATDDGAFTFDAAALSDLSAGPATITVTREIADTRSLSDEVGEILVTTRVEAWGYLDLE